MSTIDDIEKLASQVAKEAMAADVELVDRIEALKTLAPIFTAIVRAKGKESDTSEDESSNFNGFRNQIGEAEQHGTAPVRSRRRHTS